MVDKSSGKQALFSEACAEDQNLWRAIEKWKRLKALLKMPDDVSAPCPVDGSLKELTEMLLSAYTSSLHDGDVQIQSLLKDALKLVGERLTKLNKDRLPARRTVH